MNIPIIKHSKAVGCMLSMGFIPCISENAIGFDFHKTYSRTMDPLMIATRASGPIDICFDVPSSEYIIVDIIAVYSPKIGGTLTNACAYERDWGISRNETVSPAIISAPVFVIR